MLTSNGWFEIDDVGDYSLWLPPPDTADMAAEMIIKYMHKESWKINVCIITKLWISKINNLSPCTAVWDKT